HPSPAPGGGGQRAPGLHAVGGPLGLPLLGGHPPAGERRLRQGAAGGVCGRHGPADLEAGAAGGPGGGGGAHMSLISDALKKARQEAARQDSLRPGLPYAVGAVETRPARTPWISLLAGLGAGCLLAAAVFAVAFFGGWGPFRKPVAQTQVAAA